MIEREREREKERVSERKKERERERERDLLPPLSSPGHHNLLLLFFFLLLALFHCHRSLGPCKPHLKTKRRKEKERVTTKLWERECEKKTQGVVVAKRQNISNYVIGSQMGPCLVTLHTEIDFFFNADGSFFFYTDGSLPRHTTHGDRFFFLHRWVLAGLATLNYNTVAHVCDTQILQANW